MDRGALWGYSPWGHKESDTTEWLTHTLDSDSNGLKSFIALLFEGQSQGSSSTWALTRNAESQAPLQSHSIRMYILTAPPDDVYTVNFGNQFNKPSTCKKCIQRPVYTLLPMMPLPPVHFPSCLQSPNSLNCESKMNRGREKWSKKLSSLLTYSFSGFILGQEIAPELPCTFLLSLLRCLCLEQHCQSGDLLLLMDSIIHHHHQKHYQMCCSKESVQVAAH